MSKPSYAAVVAAPGKPSGSDVTPAQNNGEAPPPFADTPGPSSAPHQTLLPPQHHPETQAQLGWTPPASMQVARARALRRFWVAFFWAWAIWILIGLIIGGGVNDVNSEPVGRHGHWDRNGDWHDDRQGVSIGGGRM
ncbi:hypothetical protein BCR39DRAFT_505773 [Naematelia encephala]|uniref:Uncharacterized protein n=1 Tax=Naematelia encephala TaxID=71784 RepID=A0A1Y2B1Y4_9TREE|nr:hypothetical protein BCR39DRAFT_505773 [Naematelia encephala]